MSYRVNEIESFFTEELKLTTDDELRIIDSKKDKISFTHYTYQQYYKGIKVEHEIYKVHTKENIINRANGKIFKISITTTTPSLSSNEALDKLLTKIDAQSYFWEHSNSKEQLNYQKPKGELIIIPVL